MPASAARIANSNLSGAKLDGNRLRSANLMNANLTGASLAGADISLVVFRGSLNLGDVSFVGANLDGATYGPAVDLRGANLRGVDLSTVSVDARTLAGANLDGAILPRSRAVLSKVTSRRPFTGKITGGDIETACTDTTECSGVSAPDAASTLALTTSWAGFAFCPDGPVRLTTADGGTTYTEACGFTASQSMTTRLRERAARRWVSRPWPARPRGS